MDNKNPERPSEQRPPADETPEDVAVLYTWANLQGAKYRDFSASRREFRAQMKHRAAEAARETEEKAKTEAEEAARREEESAARMAAEANHSDEAAKQAALAAEAAKQAQKAAHDRLEAARHAEAAAAAEAAARRAEREAAEAHAHSQTQERNWEDQKAHEQRIAVPGQISDPYSKPTHDVEVEHNIHRPHASSAERAAALRQSSAIKAAVRVQPGYSSGMKKVPIVDPVPPKRTTAAAPPAPEYAAIEERFVSEDRPAPSAPKRQGFRPDVPTEQLPAYREPVANVAPPPQAPPTRWHEPQEEASPVRNFIPAMPPRRPEPEYRESAYQQPRAEEAPAKLGRRIEVVDAPEPEPVRNFIPAAPPRREEPEQPAHTFVASSERRPEAHEIVNSPVHQEPVRNYMPAPTQPSPARQQPTYEVPKMDRVIVPVEPIREEPAYRPAPPRPVQPQQAQPAASNNVRPAWLYGEERASRPAQQEAAPAQPLSDTLQHSRERVASRWFALKGVFDHSAQEQVEPQPVRKQEFRIPTLAVFSLAGGVGKTSMVATLGRALSSLGEKALLTDTTSHGLLPFYFGARELRPGVVRTFSPPPGSTDAPIYLVNYELDQKGNDQATQEWVMDEIARNGQGAHRMVLDLNGSSGWLIRRLGRLNPTILVPVAPDMNSVISLQAVEKFFYGIADAEGRAIRPHYLLNQFDASLPLHLDVREVMRQLVGDRLLPITIRRNPAVSEALAEGMTVIDYAPSSPVAEDFMNVASWVRAATAPATSGYRGARWSER